MRYKYLLLIWEMLITSENIPASVTIWMFYFFRFLVLLLVQISVA